MLEVILTLLKDLVEFIGLLQNPQAKKVEDILPEKSASEQALEKLEQKK